MANGLTIGKQGVSSLREPSDLLHPIENTVTMIRIQFITGISIALALAAGTSALAATGNIDPIRVCDDAGASCAPVNFNTAFTDKIMAQSGTTLSFGAVQQLDSSQYLNPSQADADALLVSRTLLGSTERKSFAHDVRFMNTIASNQELRGHATVSGDGAIIAADAAVDTLAHELGHDFGLRHQDPTVIDADRYLMARGAIRTIPSSVVDIASDGRQPSRFDPILPEVSVDTLGATPFQSSDFSDVIVTPGAATDLGLASPMIDLTRASASFAMTNAAPGAAGSPFAFGSLNGISRSDITVNGVTDGSPMLEMIFATDSFTSGDPLSFGLDIDLSRDIDGVGATSDELRAALVTLTFDNGYATSGDLSSLIFSSIFDPNQYVDILSGLRGDPAPPPMAPVPLTTPALLVAMAIGGLGLAGRRRHAAA